MPPLVANLIAAKRGGATPGDASAAAKCRCRSRPDATGAPVAVRFFNPPAAVLTDNRSGDDPPDEIILFHRLSASHMGPVVDIQVGRLVNLLEDRKIDLELTDAARAWLGRVGYDPAYGARPLKRAVQKYLQNPLADEILAGRVHDGSIVRVCEGEGALELSAG